MTQATLVESRYKADFVYDLNETLIKLENDKYKIVDISYARNHSFGGGNTHYSAIILYQ